MTRESVRPSIAELEAILNSPEPHNVEITTAGEVVTKGLRERIEHAINSVSAENNSNTPDFILARYLMLCLAAFDRAVRERERWYGRNPLDGPGKIKLETAPATTAAESTPGPPGSRD